MAPRTSIPAALAETLRDIRIAVPLESERLAVLRPAITPDFVDAIGPLVLATEARLHESPTLGPAHRTVGALLASHGKDTALLCRVLDQVRNDNANPQQISELLKANNDSLLSDVASQLGLTDAVVMVAGQSQAERLSAARKAATRLVGACSFLAGFAAVARLLNSHVIANRRVPQDVIDSKSTLQEYCQAIQAMPNSMPTYTILSREGPDHAPRFTCQVHIKNLAIHRLGSSANQARARMTTALQQLNFDRAPGLSPRHPSDNSLTTIRNRITSVWGPVEIRIREFRAPDHPRKYRCEVRISAVAAIGAGSSRRRAEQSAARAMLARLPASSFSPESDRPQPVRMSEHVIPQQQPPIRPHLEELLGYRFNDLRLLSIALTHKSFCHEARSPTATPYDLLATLGSKVLPWLASARMLAQTERWTHEELSLRTAVGIACRNDRLAACSSALTLDNFALFGKGQKALTDQIQSDLLQACVGAVSLDTSAPLEDVPHCCPRLLQEFFANLDAANDPVIAFDAKGYFQNLATMLGLKWQYSTHDRGPDHRRVFAARLKISSGADTFRVAGPPSRSRKQAESAVAESAIAIVRNLDPDSEVLSHLVPDEDHREQICRFLTSRLLELLREGQPGLRYLSNRGLLCVSDLLNADSDEAVSALVRLSALLRRLGLEDRLSDIDSALRLIPSTAQEDAVLALGNLVGRSEAWLRSWQPNLSADSFLEEKIFSELLFASALLARVSGAGFEPQVFQGLADAIKYLKLELVATDLSICGGLSNQTEYYTYPGFLTESLAALLTAADRSARLPTRVTIRAMQSEARIRVLLKSESIQNWSSVVDLDYLRNLPSRTAMMTLRTLGLFVPFVFMRSAQIPS